MAELLQKTGISSICATKLLLLGVGLLTILILFDVGLFPRTLNLLLSTLSPLWICLRSWLSPPYIYIVFNFIIIFIIAASSTKSNTDSQLNFNHTSSPPWQQEIKFHPNHSIVPDEQAPDEGRNKSENLKGEEKLDTIDDTWRLIMEGKGNTRKPELKKSDTWDRPPRAGSAEELEEEEAGGEKTDDPAAWARREMRKSDTFSERITLRRRLIKEKSMTNEELTHRVEAFIGKFNKEMRMQRQESQQRQDFINKNTSVYEM